MNTIELLSTMRELDIRLWAEQGRLRCDAPAGVLTNELKNELQLRKNEILNFLQLAESLKTQHPAIVPLQIHGKAPPIFAVAGHNGDVFCFRALAKHMGNNQPFFGLQPPGLDGESSPLTRVEELAGYFATQIRTYHPNGSCSIVGYCAGGSIAFELAKQLFESGNVVSSVALFGCPYPATFRLLPRSALYLKYYSTKYWRHITAMAKLPIKESQRYIFQRWRSRTAERNTKRKQTDDPVLRWRHLVGLATLKAIRSYRPGIFHGNVKMFWPDRENFGSTLKHWTAIAPAATHYFGPDGCSGASMLRDDYATIFADLFKQSLIEPAKVSSTLSDLSGITPSQLPQRIAIA